MILTRKNFDESFCLPVLVKHTIILLLLLVHVLVTVIMCTYVAHASNTHALYWIIMLKGQVHYLLAC